VDIVDSHDLFENQWIQRRRFYKKCNYRIREIDSKTYTGMAIDWETDKTWKRTFDPKTKSDTKECKKEDSDDDKTDKKQGIGKCLIQFTNFDD